VRTAQTQGRRVIFELPNGPIGGWFLIRAPYHPADFACDHLAADWYLCTEAGFD
jgi:hypothetical protein